MTPGVSEAALAALSARLGLPLAFDDDACSVMIGDQPFSIRRDGPGDRLVVSAIVADDLPDAPSRKLVEDLLNLGFGLMHDGLPAVARCWSYVTTPLEASSWTSVPLTYTEPCGR